MVAQPIFLILLLNLNLIATCDYHCCYSTFPEELREQWPHCCTNSECGNFANLDTLKRVELLRSRSDPEPICDFRCCQENITHNHTERISCCSVRECGFYNSISQLDGVVLLEKSSAHYYDHVNASVGQNNFSARRSKRQDHMSKKSTWVGEGYLYIYMVIGVCLGSAGLVACCKVHICNMCEANEEDGEDAQAGHRILVTGAEQIDNRRGRIGVRTTSDEENIQEPIIWDTGPSYQNTQSGTQTIESVHDGDLPPSYDEVKNSSPYLYMCAMSKLQYLQDYGSDV